MESTQRPRDWKSLDLTTWTTLARDVIHTHMHTLYLSLTHTQIHTCIPTYTHTHVYTRWHTHTVPSENLSMLLLARADFFSAIHNFSLTHTHTHTLHWKMSRWIYRHARSLMRTCQRCPWTHTTTRTHAFNTHTSKTHNVTCTQCLCLWLRLLLRIPIIHTVYIWWKGHCIWYKVIRFDTRDSRLKYK